MGFLRQIDRFYSYIYDGINIAIIKLKIENKNRK